MRKTVFLFVLLFCLVMLFSAATGEEAAQQVHFSGDYGYILLEDGTAEIVSYAGEEDDLVLPDKLDNITVSSLDQIRLTDGLIPHKITIPDTVQTVKGNPFINCRQLYRITISTDHPTLYVVDDVLFSRKERKLICYPVSKSDKTYSIPDGITSIEARAFNQNGWLRELTIPDTVTNIGGQAFYKCDSLRSVAIPASVVEIGINPFYGCQYLSSIVLSPDNPALAIMDGVLFSKADKRLVTFPCKLSAESYNIPQGIKIIGAYAFSGCSDLQDISIPDSVVSIGESAFDECRIESIVIPDSVREIDSYAFHDCQKLTSISIPEGVEKLGDRVFFNCMDLVSATIPDSIIEIGSNPFAACRSLEELVFSADHPCFELKDGMLLSKKDCRVICCVDTTSTSCAIPQGTKTIGSWAFNGRKNLTEILIPDSVTTIEGHAFGSCGITSIIIPDSVKSIGDQAFSMCYNLDELTIPATVTYLGESLFWGSGVTVTVERDSYAASYCEKHKLNYIYPDSNDWLND